MNDFHDGFAGLHIGLPKTATTLLQAHLFPNHPDIAYLGKHLQRRSSSEDFTPERCIETAIRRPFDTCNLTDLADRFAHAVVPYRQTGQRLVWSSEDLTVGSPARRTARAKRLRAILGPCRVFLTIRHPFRLLESLYLQLIRAQLVGLSARMGKSWHVPSLEEWLEEHSSKPEAGALGHLDYAETLQIYTSIFGEAHVRVFVFEELVRSPDDFISDLCHYLRVDPAAGLELTKQQRSNDRWTQAQLDHVLGLHRSRLSRHLVRLVPVRIRQRYLERLRNQGSSEGARVNLPAAWQTRISEQTAPGHRWMAERWHLPLAEMGYPL